jgi:hypothetical protein
MSGFSETYARGLVRRELDRIDAHSTELNRACDQQCRWLIRGCGRSVDRKLRNRDLTGFARTVSGAAEGCAARGVRIAQTAAGVEFDLGIVGALHARRSHIKDDRELFTERSLMLRRLSVRAGPKRAETQFWPIESSVSEHVLRRYVLREAGEAVTAEALAALTEQAARYALLYLRVASINTLGELPPVALAPFSEGLLIGQLGALKNPHSGLCARRDRWGSRAWDARSGTQALSVAWRTFISREMLNDRQQATLAAVEPPLRQAISTLTQDHQIAWGAPAPDSHDRAALNRARAALVPFMRAWRDTNADGFLQAPQTHCPNGDPETYEELVAALQAGAFGTTRRFLWPADIVDQVERELASAA